jgi:hypothetical protein
LSANDRLRAGLDGGVARDLDLAEHLGCAVGGFRDRGRLAREHGASGELRVDRVRLAIGAACAVVAAVDLDDAVAAAAQMACQAGAVAAGAFDPERDVRGERAPPPPERAVAGRVGAYGQPAETATERVECDGDVQVVVVSTPTMILSAPAEPATVVTGCPPRGYGP